MRARQQDQWVSSLYQAMQVAIGHELKAEYEPPKELTPKLIALVIAINAQRDERNAAETDGSIGLSFNRTLISQRY